ncbi:ribonuclease HII [Aeromicrobium sp.]|nr:ribonuclease HII [Candidatus Saccharibacteria bacterium]
MTVGIDEVGRGSWAGPVVAGAVILGPPIIGLRDSKKLSKAQREALSEEISNTALAFGIGWVEASELDEIGLTAAVGLAMQRAVDQVNQSKVEFSEIIVDGNLNYFPNDARAKAVVKADDTVPAVSAASIIAKVARDSYMANIAHKKYPEYAFDRHVGYGTSLHLQMLTLYGPTAIHRQTFRPVKALLGVKP